VPCRRLALHALAWPNTTVHALVGGACRAPLEGLRRGFVARTSYTYTHARLLPQFPGCNRSFVELWRLKVHHRGAFYAQERSSLGVTKAVAQHRRSWTVRNAAQPRRSVATLRGQRGGRNCATARTDPVFPSCNCSTKRPMHSDTYELCRRCMSVASMFSMRCVTMHRVHN
jgi:hypothetical protein